jgi:HPt (histidine-containing phosphotransfer) domain-containing protein
MDDYVSKPINTAVLIDTLNTWLAKEGGPAKKEAGAATDDDESGPVLNLTEIRERLMDDDDAVVQVIETFIRDTPAELTRLRESLVSGDMAGATLRSHSIKGAASSVGAHRVREVALGMEEACRSGEDADRVMAMLPHLERELEQFKLLVGKMGPNAPSVPFRP